MNRCRRKSPALKPRARKAPACSLDRAKRNSGRKISVRRTRIPLSSTWATGTTWPGLLVRAIHVRFWHIASFRCAAKLVGYWTNNGQRPARTLTGSAAIGRVEMWRGGVRQNISVAASFVWRCLNGSTMAPFPHPAHRTGQADFPHPALGQDFTPSLSRATPSAVSEQFSELIGCPISKSFTTCCVCLKLRSLPSTGVTRLQRYYEPLRHPKAPGLSLAGFRLVIADHALGLPVFRTLSLCTCCRHYPGAAAGRTASLIHPSRISLPRKPHRVGLRIVLFEACSAFTCVTACTLALPPYFVTRYPKASATSLPP